MKWAMIVIIAALAAGCDRIEVSAITVAPPGKIADLDTASLEIKLSRGIALGFECLIHTTEYQGPCRNARATLDNEGVVLVYKSYLDELGETWEGGLDPSQRARSAFVVVGLEVGESDLSLVTADEDVSVHITVVP